MEYWYKLQVNNEKAASSLAELPRNITPSHA